MGLKAFGYPAAAPLPLMNLSATRGPNRIFIFMGVLFFLVGLVTSLAGPQQVSREGAARRKTRQEALDGFEISRIMVHDLLIPIPSFANPRREGRNPETIKIEVQGSTDALHSFFATAMPEYKWKPIGTIDSRCWTQVHPKNTSIETVCINIPEDGKATLSVRSVGDAK